MHKVEIINFDKKYISNHFRPDTLVIAEGITVAKDSSIRYAQYDCI